MKPKVIVIDDDKAILEAISALLVDEPVEVETFDNPMSFLKKVAHEDFSFSVVVTDLKMPSVTGTELIRRLHHYSGADIPVILLTAHASLKSAIRAIREGAYDYLLKPIDEDQFKLAIRRALQNVLMSKENQSLRSQVHGPWSKNEILGTSSEIVSLREMIDRISRTDSSVMVMGESGTGKELVARAIHFQSSRRNQPFVPVNCSAIPENLLESELFGHVKGAFTGASHRKKGLFEEADGGTVFLDEIGDMPLHLQAKLLRVLQERKIKAVGDTIEKDISVRVISASHNDFRTAVSQGLFREDLYFRLSVIPIVIPPLRERKSDIPLLANHFLKEFSKQTDKNILRFSTKAMEQLKSHSWRGNIRELRNVIERAVVLSALDATEISEVFFDEVGSIPQEFQNEKRVELTDGVPLRELEREYIIHILQQKNGAKEEAARALGIDRKTLYLKEKKYGISV